MNLSQNWTNILNEFYKTAISRLSDNASLQDIADMAYKIFDIPVIILDAGYKVLACSDKSAFADPSWVSLVESGAANEETIVDCYIKDGFMQAITTAQGAIFVDWGMCTDYPQTSGPIRIDNNLSGFVSLLFMNKIQPEQAMELNALICQLCGIIMKNYHFHIKENNNPIREYLARKIFDMNNEDALENIANYAPYVNIVPAYKFIALHCNTEPNIILHHIKSRFQNVYTSILYAIDNDNLYLFCHHMDDGFDAALHKNIMKVVSNYQLYGGYSQCFSDLSKRHVYLEQAKQALYIATILKPASRISSFSEHYMEIALLPIASQLFYENAVPSQLRLLKEYDLQNQTDYLISLKAYIFQGCDINKAAASLHLHRNSLVYRLGKIYDMMNVDIHDTEMGNILFIGLKIMELRDKIH